MSYLAISDKSEGLSLGPPPGSDTYDNIFKICRSAFQLPRSKHHQGMIVLVLYKIILAARNIFSQ